MSRNPVIYLSLLVAVFVAVPPGTATARTWRVEKNGSGDFFVIQQAIDAASSGDTIQIGPGRYTEYRWYNSSTVHYNQIISKSLTLIGAGATETIIGHESFGFPLLTSGAGIIIMGDVDSTRLS